MVNSNGLIVALTKAANYFVVEMKSLLNSGNYPKGGDRGNTSIQDAISIGTAHEQGNAVVIDVSIDLKKAPYAAAFEWGSGIHSMRGGRSLYPIRAKNTTMLKFWWAEKGKWFVGTALPFGHPGIAADPYIFPTMLKTKQEIRKIIGKDFISSLMVGKPSVTVIEVKI